MSESCDTWGRHRFVEDTDGRFVCDGCDIVHTPNRRQLDRIAALKARLLATKETTNGG